MSKIFAVAFCALVIGACQPATQREIASAAVVNGPASGSVKVGLGLSEALCSGCHAIAIGQTSPNPQAPTFEMIANTGGLTLETLGEWMHDSHNFPENMNFEVADEDVDDLAAYVITLRSEDYKPPIQ